MVTPSKTLISLLAVIGALAACSSSDSPVGTDTAGAPAGGSSGAGAGAAGHGGSSTAGAPHGGASPSGSAGSAGQLQGSAGALGGGGNASGGHAGAAGVSGAREAGSGEAGSDGEGGDGEGGGPDGAAQAAYVGTVVGGVYQCSVDPASGVPSLLPGVTVGHTGNVAMLAVDPAQRFLYVADENKHIDTFAIGEGGKLPAQPTFTITTPDTLNTLAIDPQGRFAYAGSVQGSAIYVFKIDPTSGKLDALGDPVLTGTEEDKGGANYIAPDPSGHFIYVSQGAKVGIRGFSVSAAGKLEEIAGSPFATAETPVLFGGALAFEPSGDFLYSAGGGLRGFKVAPVTGKLEQLAGSPFTTDIGSDPDATSLAVDPQGKYLYSVAFLVTNHVRGFAIKSDGALEQVPHSPINLGAPYSVAVDRTGHWLYVGVDGPDGLAVYSIARSNGELTQVQAASPGIGGLEPIITFASLH